MGSKGQLKPFKMMFTFPGSKTRTEAHSTFDAADLHAGEAGRRGAQARVVFRSESRDVPFTAYGPDVQHTVTETFHPGANEARFLCTCGARDFPRYSLGDHLQRIGLEPVVWKVVDDSADGPAAGPGAEPGPLGIDVPGYIRGWAQTLGAVADNPGYHLVVTTPDEVHSLDLEIASRGGALPAEEVEAIRDARAARFQSTGRP